MLMGVGLLPASKLSLSEIHKALVIIMTSPLLVQTQRLWFEKIHTDFGNSHLSGNRFTLLFSQLHRVRCR